MSEEATRHEVVRLQHTLYVLTMDADGHTHDHVLRALNDALVDAHQISTAQRLEPKVIVAIVSVVDNRAVQSLLVLHDDLQDLITHQRRVVPRFRVHIGMKLLHHIRKDLGGLLVQIRHTDARGKGTEVRVTSRTRGSSLGSKLI